MGWPSNTTATRTSLTLTLPANGDFVRFRIAGEFGRPSYNDKDVILRVHENDANGTLVGSHRLMVRVRKDGNRLHDPPKSSDSSTRCEPTEEDLAAGRNYDQNAGDSQAIV